MELELRSVEVQGGHKVGGRVPLYIFTFWEKKIREKDSSLFTIRSRRQALIIIGRADLESVRGSG